MDIYVMEGFQDEMNGSSRVEGNPFNGLDIALEGADGYEIFEVLETVPRQYLPRHLQDIQPPMQGVDLDDYLDYLERVNEGSLNGYDLEPVVLNGAPLNGKAERKKRREERRARRAERREQRSRKREARTQAVERGEGTGQLIGKGLAKLTGGIAEKFAGEGAVLKSEAAGLMADYKDQAGNAIRDILEPTGQMFEERLSEGTGSGIKQNLPLIAAAVAAFLLLK